MPQTLYAIGDIHGDLEQLQRIHSWIESDIARHHIQDPILIHIGDLVDRRPDSNGVISHLISGIDQGKPWVVLQGNHDRMFNLFLKDPLTRDPVLRPDLTWLHDRLGGATTLLSYGIEFDPTKPVLQTHREVLDAVPQAHRHFLDNLPNVWQSEKYFFCHAGVKSGVALDEQAEDDLIWIRKPFQTSTEDYGKIIVHGHTPIDRVTHYGNRINIDTGAAYGKALSAIVLDGTGVSQITADGRAEILRLPPGNI